MWGLTVLNVTAHAFHDYNVAFNFCHFRALPYKTLDNLSAVFRPNRMGIWTIELLLHWRWSLSSSCHQDLASNYVL